MLGIINQISVENNTVRELLFFALAMIGAIIIGLCVSFLAVALSIGTSLPAPFFASSADQQIVLSISVFGIGFGLVVIRFGAKFIGY